MASTGFIESRRPAEGHLGTHRNHGIYSSKIKVPLGADISNKPTSFNSVGMPYVEPNGSKNLPGRWKGKQVMTRWPHTGEFFRKLEYAPAAYDDTSKRDKVKKSGFGSTGKLNRDDLSSTIEVGRYRAQLEIELRGANAATMAQQQSQQLGIAERGRRPTTAPTIGMTTSMRSFTSEFDRANFVEEFTTKNPPGMGALKGERYLGSLRPMSADHGEGCTGRALQSPAHAVGNFSASLQSKYARPSTSGRSFLVPIGV
jgi:hypothetical protein